MAFEIILAPEAVEDVHQLDAFDWAAVTDALERHLRHEPAKVSRSRIKRLRDMRRPQFRLRVDDIRVFYDVREDTVEILAIVSKANANEWLEREGESDEGSSSVGSEG